MKIFSIALPKTQADFWIQLAEKEGTTRGQLIRHLLTRIQEKIEKGEFEI